MSGFSCWARHVAVRMRKARNGIFTRAERYSCANTRARQRACPSRAGRRVSTCGWHSCCGPHIVATRMKNSASLPLVDVETYVPAAITVVRRSRGWPGVFLQERRGESGHVGYASGIRQHVFYFFLKPLRSDVVVDGEVRKVFYRAGEGRLTPAGRP